MTAKYKYESIVAPCVLKAAMDDARKLHKQKEGYRAFDRICTLARGTKLCVAKQTAKCRHTKVRLHQYIMDCVLVAITYYELWCKSEAGLASAKLRVASLLESRAVIEKHLNVVMNTKNVLKDTIDSLEFKVYNAEEKLHNTENARLNLVAKCDVFQSLADARRLQINSLEMQLVQVLRFEGEFDRDGTLCNLLKLTCADYVLPQACDLLDEGKDNEE